MALRTRHQDGGAGPGSHLDRAHIHAPLKSTALALTGFAIVYTMLAAVSLTRTSATWDEPQHLAAGYTALVERDYRVDPEHPPLARMLAAIPLAAAGDPDPPTARMDESDYVSWVTRGLFGFAHDVLYVDRYADRRVYAARFGIVALGVLMGALVFAWAREWLGRGPALAALVMCAFEPNLLAHGSLVTTDFGVTVLVFAAVYMLWRVMRSPSAANIAGFAAAFACAQVTKFSALSLVPILAMLFAVAIASGAMSVRTAAWSIAALALATVAGIWAMYGLRFAPSDTAGWLYRVYDDPAVQQRVRWLASIVRWTDARHLLPNAYANGLLLSQAKAQAREAFLAGSFSDTGWWYYFPAPPMRHTTAFATRRCPDRVFMPAAGSSRRRCPDTSR